MGVLYNFSGVFGKGCRNVPGCCEEFGVAEVGKPKAERAALESPKNITWSTMREVIFGQFGTAFFSDKIT